MVGKINRKLTHLYQETSGMLQLLHTLTSDIGHEPLTNTVKDIIDRLETPFTFVIVGEVKAGKSSFINALLESKEEICKVAPMPMTDTIQQIVYGPIPVMTDINPYLKRIEQPIDILQEIAIVDTPGTNTIVDHHQEITERFIPFSDLIVFVFEAKNPYRQSSWEFFDYINEEWHRKIIFVLQQKDLINEGDLAINLQGVRDQAIKKGVTLPNVFAVSAKLELEGQQEQSGFSAIREYITQNITGGKAPKLKLNNSLQTSETILQKISQSLNTRKEQWHADVAFRTAITETLNQQEQKTNYQVSILSENILASYDSITQETIDTLDEGMSIIPVMKRSFSSVFGSTPSLKTWLETEAKSFEQKLNSSLKSKLQYGIEDIADSIQTMAKLVHAQLKESKTVLTDNDEIFADIAERRANVLKELQDSFSDFMHNAENFYDEKMASESGKMAPNLAAGSGIAVVGVILATITNGAVFDITGGILTAVGVLFASVSLGWKRRKILQQFRAEIENGRTSIKRDVGMRLNDYTARIKQRIDDNFFSLDRLLELEGSTLQKFDRLGHDVSTQLEKLKKEAEAI